MPLPLPAERPGAAQHHGQADLARRLARLRDRTAGDAARRLHPDLVEPADEALAILGVDDGLDRGAEDAHPVAFQPARAVQLEPAVERSLAAEGEQDRIDLLLLDDLLHPLGRDRDEVDPVRHPLAGLDRRHVGVDQHRRDPLLAHRLDRLRAGIVELAGLADLQRAGAEDQDLAGTRGKIDAVHRSGRLHRRDPAQEVVEQHPGVPRPGARLGMELDAGIGRELAAYALVGAVIEVGEPRLPALGQARIPDRVAVVLAGHEAAPGQQVLHPAG